MSLKSIFLCALVCGFVWYILKSRETKEFAVAAVAQYCQRLSLTLLDQTVALASIKLGRSSTGSIQLVRLYRFDFSSNGEDRYNGTITMHGKRVDQIQLEPHRID